MVKVLTQKILILPSIREQAILLLALVLAILNPLVTSLPIVVGTLILTALSKQIASPQMPMVQLILVIILPQRAIKIIMIISF